MDAHRSGMCFMSAGAAAAAPAIALQEIERCQQSTSFRPPGHPARTGPASKPAGPLHDPHAPGSIVLNMQQWQVSKVLYSELHSYCQSFLRLHAWHVAMACLYVHFAGLHGMCCRCMLQEAAAAVLPSMQRRAGLLRKEVQDCMGHCLSPFDYPHTMRTRTCNILHALSGG